MFSKLFCSYYLDKQNKKETEHPFVITFNMNSLEIISAEEAPGRLFNKWSYDEVEIKDLALSDYISVRNHVYVPHTAGRYQMKKFRKATCPITERLTNSLMMHGRNNGKKLMAARIVKHAFEIINLLITYRFIRL